MENLPKNVINKIMFYTNHPVADIIRESSMFRAFKLSNEIRIHGSPFDRGESDVYYGRAYDPHKMILHSRVELDNDDEIKQYEAAYVHTCATEFKSALLEQLCLETYGYHIRYRIQTLWKLIRELQDSDSSEES